MHMVPFWVHPTFCRGVASYTVQRGTTRSRIWINPSPYTLALGQQRNSNPAVKASIVAMGPYFSCIVSRTSNGSQHAMAFLTTRRVQTASVFGILVLNFPEILVSAFF